MPSREHEDDDARLRCCKMAFRGVRIEVVTRQGPESATHARHPGRMPLRSCSCAGGPSWRPIIEAETPKPLCECNLNARNPRGPVTF